MAVGSNTLGLLFKIGVDVSGIKEAFKGGLNEGAAKEIKEFEKTTKDAFQRVGDSTKGISTGVNQAVNSLRQLSSGEIGSGVTNLGKSIASLGAGLGIVAVAAAVVAVAVYAAVKAFQAITSAAAEIGTRSKDAFNELQKNATAAGTPITALQRNLSAGIVGALDQVKGAANGFMAKVIEVSGPALIKLLNEIAKLLVDLQPLAVSIGNILAESFILATASVRTFRDLLKQMAEDRPPTEEELTRPWQFTSKGMTDFMDLFRKNLADARKEIAALVVPTAPFDPEKTKKAAKDLTDAQVEQNKAARELALQREKAAAGEAEINRMLKAGAIDADEAAGRRLAILATTRIFELALFDAEKNRIEQDVKGAKRQKDALAELQNRKDIAKIEDAERQKAISAQQDKDQTKITEAALKQLDEILKKQKDIDAIIQARAAAPGGAPGAPLAVEGQVPGLPSDADIQAGLDKALAHYQSFWTALQIGFQNAAKNARDNLVKAVEDLPTSIVDAFTDSFRNLLDTFIQTGQTGPAVMKQFVAAVLRALGQLAALLSSLAFAYAIFCLAFGDYYHAALATAAGVALAAVAIALGFAAKAVAPSQASNAAGGGGGFGGGADQPPGTVTINQGAATSGLGIQLQILNALQNITTAPPGDILQRGADQNPMAVGQANNEAARRDGSVSREFLQISGLRTA